MQSAILGTYPGYYIAQKTDGSGKEQIVKYFKRLMDKVIINCIGDTMVSTVTMK